MTSKIGFSNSNIGNRNKYILIGICATVLIVAVLLTALRCFLKNKSKNKEQIHNPVNNKTQQPYEETQKPLRENQENLNLNHRNNNLNSANSTNQEEKHKSSTISEEQESQSPLTTQAQTPPPPPPPPFSSFFTTNTPTTNKPNVPDRNTTTLTNKSAQQQIPFILDDLTNLELKPLKSTTASKFDKKAVAQGDVQNYFEENLICSKENTKNAIVQKLAAGGVTNTMEYKFGITGITDFSYQNSNSNAANLSFKATICEDLNAKNLRTQEVEFLFKINDKNELELLNENEADNQNEKQIDRLKKSMINYKAEISKTIITKWDTFVKDYRSPMATLNHDTANNAIESSIIPSHLDN